MQTLPDPSAAAVQYQGSTVCNGIWNTRACKSPPEVYHRRATFFRFEELFAHFPRDCGSILETGISTRFIYEALLVRGFVERAYIATQAAENACSCLNTRDRSVYRPLLLFMYTRMALCDLPSPALRFLRIIERRDQFAFMEFTLAEIRDDVSAKRVEACTWFRCVIWLLVGLFMGFDGNIMFRNNVKSFLSSLRMFVESIDLFI